MIPKDIDKFAHEWINSWNSHDIERILAHYSKNFEITTPMIKKLLNIDNGTLKGKENIKEYWLSALKKVPDLNFTLLDVTKSIDSIALYYESVLNTKAIEVMFFDDQEKINKVVAHYTL